MPSGSNLHPDDFAALLKWLAPHPQEAGLKYQEIHKKLTNLFAFKGCNRPEELADVVIDRVAKKVAQSPPEPEDWVRVFYSFSKYVFLEFLHTQRALSLGFPSDDQRFNPALSDPRFHYARKEGEEDDLENQHRCLEECLSKLPDSDSALLRNYYNYAVRSKAMHRRHLAESEKCSLEALRIRVCRSRTKVTDCVIRCVHNQDPSRVQR